MERMLVSAGIAIILFYIAIIVLCIAGLWAVFVKAGKPGWGVLIPFYNIILLLEVAGKPAWWLILMLIPFVGFIISILVYIDVAKNFGEGAGFAIGLLILPFIFWPLLGFGNYRYQGTPG